VSTLQFDSAALRRTLGRFATGVAIITATGHDRRPVGMTCNSFTSVSLQPPLVQFSIARTSRNHSLICQVEHFAVHVLDAAQEALCRQFSATDRDRFLNVELEAGLHDLPVLKRYHARFECAAHVRHEAGDHTIVIGRVLRLSEQDGAPLIFYRGALASLAP
jgi:flavin reductase (DIM6/NTAB) family NADH-FMN oxidoreductase RutF